jgi:hypothetical protein
MTNWFEVYYSELLQYAERVITAKKLQLDPADLVNQAYIDFIEQGIDFDLAECKKYISAGSLKEFYFNKTKTNLGDSTAKRQIKGDKCCTICNNAYPVGYFKVYKFAGHISISNYCKDCERERNNLWYRNWLSIPENRARWNTYVNNRRRQRGQLSREEYNKRRRAKAKPIHELWKNANKKYQERQKENLTDVYIRGILKAGRKSFSPEAIIKKRDQLIEKRRLANSTIKNKAA